MLDSVLEYGFCFLLAGGDAIVLTALSALLQGVILGSYPLHITLGIAAKFLLETKDSGPPNETVPSLHFVPPLHTSGCTVLVCRCYKLGYCFFSL